MYYTYIIWNKENKMKYIGYHKDRDDMDTYYGSPVSKHNKESLEFQRILKEEKSILKKRVLQWFNTEKEAINHEIYLHNKYKVDTSKEFYNVVRQSSNGFVFNKKHSDETKAKMSKSHLKAGNKPPHISTWWTKEHSEKLSEKMKGNTYKLGIKETEVTRKRKKEAFAKSKKFQDHIRRERSKEERQKISSNRKGKALGEKNGMACPENRKKVSESKIGLKKLMKNGKSRLAKPGTDKWNSLISEGYIPRTFMSART